MLQDRTWLLIGRKIANEASIEEVKELEDILRSNPELHFSLQALNDIWKHRPPDNINELKAAYTAHLSRMKSLGIEITKAEQEEDAENIPRGRIAEPHELLTNRSIAWMTMATIIIFMVALAIAPFLQPNFSKPEQSSNSSTKASSEISTRNGSKTNIVLPDGTKVWLNAGSKLTYDKNFGNAMREVALTGEAYFNVAHNSGKPFIIHTRGLEIKVLGTEFNVKSYPGDLTTETSLIQGSIEVTLKDGSAEKIILKPNEKLVITNDHQISKNIDKKKTSAPIISLSRLNYFSVDSTILETSWVHNRLVFEDESFSDLATRLSRWYGMTIVFEDPELQKLRFTGNFKDETIYEALNAMKITAAFDYTINNKTIFISK